MVRTNGSLERGLLILEFIASQPKGAKLSEVARRVGQPTSNTTIFINTLVEEGWIFKDLFTGSYHLTGKIQDVAALSDTDSLEELKMAALPEMKKLHTEYNENVILSVLDHSFLVCIQEISSTKAIRIFNREGELFLPHLTAAGKAILANMSEEKRNIYLEQTNYAHPTEVSIVNQSALCDELDRIRNQGWALNLGEYDDQIFGVAAPIITTAGVYGLAVQYPKFRHDEAHLERYAMKIIESANAISLSAKRKQI